MKALILERPRDIAVREVQATGPAACEALLQVRLVGLCGTDLNSFRGRNPLVSYPRIPGHEIAATIVSGGSATLPDGANVTVYPYSQCGACAACLRGRPNACQHNQTLGVQRDGALREFISVAPNKLFPARLELQELCLVEPLSVGFHAAARGEVRPGEIAVVIGCGGVGLGAVAACAFRGAETVAVDVDDHKLEIAKLAGATHCINTERQELHASLQEIAQGRGPDVVIEAIGLPQTFRAAVEEVAFTGRVVYIGYAKEPVSYETRLFVQKELDIRGSRNALPEDFREVIRMLEQGRFPARETITTVAPLEKGPELLSDWDATPARYSKIMLQVS